MNQSLLEIEESAKPVTLDQSAVGRVSRTDAIGQQQLQLASQQRIKIRRQALRNALQRIANDDQFGLCQKCEESIPLKRLLARPESPICMDCLKRS